MKQMVWGSAPGQGSKSQFYLGNYVYSNGVKQLLVDGGYVTFSGTTPQYHFYLKDHLGNNRVIVNASGTVEQVNHYYAYGALMGESTGGDVQDFKYNGKELDRLHGLDWFDYGARHYDGVIGSWPTMDPLCEKYYSISPYAYCANSPILYIDPNGMDIWEINDKGNVVNYEETKEYDMIRMQDSNVSPLKFKYGTINHKSIKIDDSSEYDLFQINGDENGKSVFEMVAQNTDVEWTKAQLGEQDGVNIITTSHEANVESGFSHYISNNFKEGMTIRDITHNHPSGSAFPSFGINKNSGDVPFANYINNLTKQNPSYHIYTLSDGKYSYIKYNANSTINDFILNGVSLDGIEVFGKRH